MTTEMTFLAGALLLAAFVQGLSGLGFSLIAAPSATQAIPDRRQLASLTSLPSSKTFGKCGVPRRDSVADHQASGARTRYWFSSSQSS